MELEVTRVELAKMSLAPGDTLLVRAKAPITREIVLRLQECFREAAPEGVTVVIVTNEIEVTHIPQGEALPPDVAAHV